MFLIDPLFSPWVVIFIFLGLIFLAWKAAEGTLELFCLWGTLSILLLVGLQVSYHTVNRLPPAHEIQVISENFVRENEADQIDHLRRDLKKQPGAENIRFKPLDRRWERRPVFEDYNRLIEKTGDYPVEIIVGRGRHTAVSPGYFSPRNIADSPPRRLLLEPDSTAGDGLLKLEKPVVSSDSPRPVTWRVEISRLEDLEEPRLVLWKGGEIVRELSPPAPEGVVEISSPELEEGVHYFTIGLLEKEEDRQSVPPKRRASAGAIIEDFSRRLLVVDDVPSWRSGWWGRKINSLQNWEVDYHYREFDRERPGPADVVLYFGFPTSGSQLDDFSRLRENSGFLFVIHDIEAALSVPRTLQELGVDGREIVRRRGEFEISLPSEAAEVFPPLLAFSRQLEVAPPVDHFYHLPGLEDYSSLLEADGQFILGFIEDHAGGILAYPDFHRLAMRWGELGYERAGGELAREIIQKLEREHVEEEGRLIDRRWVFAGEKFSLGREISQLQLESPVEREWLDEPPEELSFPRPGKYNFSYRRDGEEFTEQLLVVESDRMRHPEGAKRIEGLVSPENVFDSPARVVDRARELWEESHRKQKVEIFNWGNPLLLVMAGIFLTLGWLLADRHEV